MTEASTDEPTRPITERDKQIIATLPGCPDWCDRKHAGLDGPMEAALWHEHVIGEFVMPSSETLNEDDQVSVRLTSFEHLSENQVLRGPTVVSVEITRTAGPFYLTADNAVHLSGLLCQAADQLVELNEPLD